MTASTSKQIHPVQEVPDVRAASGARPLWATTFSTAEGYAAVAASAHGLVACTWHHRDEHEAADSLNSILRPLLSRKTYLAAAWLAPDEGLPPHLAAARAGLTAYGQGNYDALCDLEIDGRARTPFVARVHRVVQAIPSGSVLTYGDVARLAGSRGAARAVGQCMATNPLAPIVPCHRVIAANGNLGGFGPGLPAKVRLLQREGVDATLNGVKTKT